MEILVVTQFYPPSLGGMQTSNLLLVNGLKSAGHYLNLLVISSQSSIIEDDADYERELLSYNLASPMVQVQAAFVMYRRISRMKPDIVLCLDDSINRLLALMPFNPSLGSYYISVNSGSTLVRNSKTFRSLINIFLVKKGYDKLDLIFVSDSTSKSLKESYPCFSDRICVAGRPIPDYFYKERVQVVNHDAGLPVFFSCSRAEHEKGLGLVIKALAKLRDKYGKEVAALTYAGDGPALHVWKMLVIELRLNEVSFLGQVSHDLLPQYFLSSYMSILPSFYLGESFGRTWMESFSCSTPVISTLTENLKYIVFDGFNGIVVEPNVESIERAIEKAISMSAEEYNCLSKNAYNFSLKYKQSSIVDDICARIEVLEDANPVWRGGFRI